MALTKAATLSVQPIHPELKEASYISGTILYDNSQMDCASASQKFILVYGNCHVSPLNNMHVIANNVLLEVLQRNCILQHKSLLLL